MIRHFGTKAILVWVMASALVVPATAETLDRSVSSNSESLPQSVRVSELATNPDQYVGKQIQIVGLVEDVCPVRGCWASVKDAEDSSQIRFKVPDGRVVFTAKMVGDVVEAAGVFTRYTKNELGQYEKTKHADYVGEAMYLLEGHDASLICSENQLTTL
jgi:cytochrome c-type biogenesis protein CcmE